jgi:hypothetical protein
MNLKALFIISAIYMTLLGLGFIFLPGLIGIGAVPVDASPALTAYLRVFGSTFVAIGVLNWVARAAEASQARNAIVVANMVGFGLAALLDVWGAFNGARPLAWLFAVIHFLFTLAFAWARRVSMAKQKG